MERAVLLGLSLVAIAGTCAADAAPPSAEPPQPLPALESHPVRARMVAQRQELLPGRTCLIGITLDIEPGWHVYWDGAGDNGMPVSVTPALPPGFKAGELRWPVPRRHIDAGDILDYVYEKRVTLVLPVTVPADAKPGDKADLSATVEWFVCKDVCIRAEGRVALSVPIATPGQPDSPLTAEADLFAGPYPKPSLPDWIKPAWKDRTLSLPATGPGAAGITRMVFYPARTGVTLADPLHQGEVAGSTLSLDIKPGEAGGSARVRGVLEVVRGASSPSESFTVDIPVPQRTGS